MSTYSSDEQLQIDTAAFFDVAWDCFGRDVRILGFGGHEYLSTDDARQVAAALIRCADNADLAAVDGEEGTRKDHT